MRQLIRSDGTSVDFEEPLTADRVEKLLGAPQEIDTIHLRHLGLPAHLMVVDDTGMCDRLPVNLKASEIYWQSCAHGPAYPIHGDVVIVPAAEYRANR
jgi:hypothetical protein